MAEIVGEDAWVSAIQKASESAGDLEARVEVVELYKQAISEEPCSMRLWLGYCEWVWSLYTESQNENAGWAEEERLLGQELFGKEIALAIWQQGAEATKFRLNDSHQLWNKWIRVEISELEKAGDEQDVIRVRNLFEARLQVPHSAWDDTFQMFSNFMTNHDESGYEAAMVKMVQVSKSAKDLYAQREEYEHGIQRAVQEKDEGAEWLAWKNYLDWENFQNKKKAASLELSIALHERALLRYGTVSADLWEDYADLIHQISPSNPQDSDDLEEPEESRYLSVLKSATNHCPWSSQLWVRCLLTAESDRLSFSAIEEIKEAAINQKVDASTGLELVYQVCAAWCGVLRRQSDSLKLLSEGDDLALKGVRSSVEEVEKLGNRIYGKKKYSGDPNYRLEQTLIQCVTERGLVEEARNLWKKLVTLRGTSYEFWQRYYNWEMNIWASSSDAQSEAPAIATELLSQASNKKGLDWPEKITQMLVEHCEKYEDAATIQNKLILARGIMKGVAKRREREAAQAAAAFEAQQTAVVAEVAVPEAQSSGSSKRKRESDPEDVDNASKKTRSEENPTTETAESQKAVHEQHLKRDRENTSIIVTNLPAEVTQTKVRQYFKEYGHINNLTMKNDDDGLASTALIEFRSTDDVKSAFLRDGKYFGENQIQVKPATGLTLYVTNYPPTADENYMQELFKDCGDIFSIRWPSLKYNTHRRFCYISFRTPEAAAAATKLDGKVLEGKYNLLAKYSDPGQKKTREGAANEGRELHIANLDRDATEDELKEIFSKYGMVESVRILRNVTGRSKGGGFVVFEKKENAIEALALDKTSFKGRIFTVELSTTANFKPKATSSTISKASSASPAPQDENGDISMTPPANTESTTTTNTHALHGPSSAEIAGRTIAIMNIPDTLNDSRVRALVSQYGKIVKLVLRPDHQGAIIEYEDVASAGKASLALEGHEIAPGRKLRTGGVKELFKEKEEHRSDRIVVGGGGANSKKPVNSLQPSAPIRRPGQAKRGGLGAKRGLGFVGAISSGSKPAPEVSVRGGDGDGEEEGKAAPQKKSNADFAAMFKKEQKPAT